MLQFSQLTHEHSLRDVRELLAQFVKAMRSDADPIKDESLPSAADYVNRRLDGATSRLEAIAMVQ